MVPWSISALNPCAFPVLPLSGAALPLPATAQAQSLGAGIWSGSIIDPYGQSKPVVYDVAGPPDSLSITLSQPSGGRPAAFADVHLVADTPPFRGAGGAQGSRAPCKLFRKPDGG